MSKIITALTKRPCVFSLQVVPERKKLVEFYDYHTVALSVIEALSTILNLDAIFNITALPTVKAKKNGPPSFTEFLTCQPIFIELDGDKLNLLKFISLFDTLVGEILIRNNRWINRPDNLARADHAAFRSCLELRYANTDGTADDTVIIFATLGSEEN